MFNIGLTEILLIVVIALLILGPKRLPAAAQTCGRWLGYFRRNYLKIRKEIEQEINFHQDDK